MGSDQIESYRRIRDELTWLAGLFASIEQPEKQRTILSEWGSLAKRSDLFMPEQALVEPLSIKGLILEGADENLQSWLMDAKPNAIAQVCIHFVESLKPIGSLQFIVDQNKDGNVVRATPCVTCLPEALHWMLLQDVLHGHPIRFCEVCGDLIRNTVKRERKFCSAKCGSIKSARDAKKRKRDRERAKNVA
jgi:predicted nucleic acid-binding Zn ribbon protein